MLALLNQQVSAMLVGMAGKESNAKVLSMADMLPWIDPDPEFATESDEEDYLRGLMAGVS